MKPRDSVLVATVVAAIGSAAGCASGSGGSDAASRNAISRDELVATNTQWVYDALQRTKPQWLTARGVVSLTDPSGTRGDPTEARPNVYMHGNRVGDVDYLRQVSVLDVEEVRFWPPGEAGARFGMGNPRGVIEIIPRR